MMMLRSIQLENFKAFGQRTVIPFAPITLIFGQNSAGKSSILQALNLLKQTRESRDVEALLLPRTENGFVDLGSFQEILFDHDLSRTLAIRMEMELPRRNEGGVILRSHPDLTSISVELDFVRRTLEEEVSLDKLSLFIGGEQIASFIPTKPQEDYHMFGSPVLRYGRRRFTSTIRAMRCAEVTSSESFWRNPLEQTLKHREKMHKGLQEVRTSLSKSRSKAQGDLFEEEKPATLEQTYRKLD